MEEEEEGGRREGMMEGKCESHMKARQDSPGHYADIFQGSAMMWGWLQHHYRNCHLHYSLMGPLYIMALVRH